MKRDMDLVRAILKHLADRDLQSAQAVVSIEGYSKDKIAGHLEIMEDKGLVDGVTGMCAACKRMTWEGHEFLEASRDDTIWNKAKALVLEKTGGLSFEALKAALVKLVVTTVESGL